MRLSGTRGADSDKSGIARFDKLCWSNARLGAESEPTHDSSVEPNAVAPTMQYELWRVEHDIQQPEHVHDDAADVQPQHFELQRVHGAQLQRTAQHERNFSVLDSVSTLVEPVVEFGRIPEPAGINSYRISRLAWNVTFRRWIYPVTVERTVIVERTDTDNELIRLEHESDVAAPAHAQQLIER
jgi:hypothetical protein